MGDGSARQEDHPTNTAYKDVGYLQALALSTSYQGGIVLWVAFWSLYGHGFGAETLAAVATFGSGYMLVVIVEPLTDLAVLAGAKHISGAPRRLFPPSPTAAGVCDTCCLAPADRAVLYIASARG